MSSNFSDQSYYPLPAPGNSAPPPARYTVKTMATSPPPPAITADSIVLSVDLPGAGEENIGVLLVERDSGTPWRRFRRDLATLDPDNADILDLLEEDIALKMHEMGATRWLEWLEENASNFLRVSDREQHTAIADFRQAVNWLYHRHVRPKVLPFRTHLPLYAVEAAAGRWGPEQEVDENEPGNWVEAPSTLRRITEDMFVAKVTGHSMEPLIPAGSLCVFRGGNALVGSRQGKRVLVANYGEPGEQRFTVKRYESVKQQVDDDRQQQTRIILHPLNPEYESWEIDPENGRVRVVGEFVAVLDDLDPAIETSPS